MYPYLLYQPKALEGKSNLYHAGNLYAIAHMYVIMQANVQVYIT